jgi:hypothetical protein
MSDGRAELEAHPWRRFVQARKDAIEWLAAAGETDERIAAAVSLLEYQVTRIRRTPREDIK